MITNYNVRKMMKAVCREKGIAGSRGLYVEPRFLIMFTVQALVAKPEEYDSLWKMGKNAIQRGIKREWLETDGKGNIRLRRRK